MTVLETDRLRRAVIAGQALACLTMFLAFASEGYQVRLTQLLISDPGAPNLASSYPRPGWSPLAMQIALWALAVAAILGLILRLWPPRPQWRGRLESMVQELAPILALAGLLNIVASGVFISGVVIMVCNLICLALPAPHSQRWDAARIMLQTAALAAPIAWLSVSRPVGHNTWGAYAPYAWDRVAWPTIGLFVVALVSVAAVVARLRAMRGVAGTGLRRAAVAGQALACLVMFVAFVIEGIKVRSFVLIFDDSLGGGPNPSPIPSVYHPAHPWSPLAMHIALSAFAAAVALGLALRLWRLPAGGRGRLEAVGQDLAPILAVMGLLNIVASGVFFGGGVIIVCNLACLALPAPRGQPRWDAARGLFQTAALALPMAWLWVSHPSRGIGRVGSFQPWGGYQSWGGEKLAWTILTLLAAALVSLAAVIARLQAARRTG